jgi:hypothetical protein
MTIETGIKPPSQMLRVTLLSRPAQIEIHE